MLILRQRWKICVQVIFVHPLEELEEMAYIYPSVKMLTELVNAFEQQFKAAKADRNMLDFSDLEHDMLRLLADFSEDENGRMRVTPTSVADELCEFYEEVVCDEYQDSNLVQELILSLLSRGEKVSTTVLWSVMLSRVFIGSDWQMQRFLWINIIAMQMRQRMKHMQRIDLSRNFRSRESVLSGINYFPQDHEEKVLAGLIMTACSTLSGNGISWKHPAKYCRLCGSAFPDSRFGGSRSGRGGGYSFSGSKACCRQNSCELTDSEHGLDIYDSDLGNLQKGRI